MRKAGGIMNPGVPVKALRGWGKLLTLTRGIQ